MRFQQNYSLFGLYSTRLARTYGRHSTFCWARQERGSVEGISPAVGEENAREIGRVGEVRIPYGSKDKDKGKGKDKSG